MTMRDALGRLRRRSNFTKPRIGRALFVLVATWVTSFSAQAQDKQEKKKDTVIQQMQQKKADAAKRNEAARKAAIKQQPALQRVVRVQNQWTDENFDQWVFQQDRNPDGARRRFDSSLRAHVAAIQRTTHLTDVQTKKLQLAGRGDVKRFFDRYEAAKHKFQSVKDDQQKVGNIWQDINPLQMKLQTDLFDGNSLFYKSLHNTLTSEQWAKYDAAERERREFSYRVSIERAVFTWEQNMPLREVQRRELIALLTNQAKPPQTSVSQYESTLIQFHLSQIPEEKLRHLFDEKQWKIIGWYVNQGKGMGPFLRQMGLLGEEADQANARRGPVEK
jgi:hypothetical protein